MGGRRRKAVGPDAPTEEPPLEIAEESREAIRSLRRELPGTKDALLQVVKTTERATHALLEHVEEAIELDHASRELIEEVLAKLYKRQGKAKEALAQVLEAYDRRGTLLTRMMTELSFQDLTSQTIQRARVTIGEVDDGLGAVIRDGATGGAMRAEDRAGVDRLREAQAGGSRQSMVDDVLRRR